MLIAEDDKFLKNVLKSKLTAEGFQILMTSDGVETMEMVAKEKPDILLLDIIMPRKNGFDVLEEIRLNAQIRDLPVIILSNLGQDEDVKRGLALGAVDFLIKSDHSLSEVVDKVKLYAATTKKK